MFFNKKSKALEAYNKVCAALDAYLEEDDNLDNYQTVIDFYCTGRIYEGIEHYKLSNSNYYEAIYFIYFKDLQMCQTAIQKAENGDFTYLTYLNNQKKDDSLAEKENEKNQRLLNETRKRAEADQQVLDDLEEKRKSFYVIEGLIERIRKLERHIEPEYSRLGAIEVLLHLDKLKSLKQL